MSYRLALEVHSLPPCNVSRNQHWRSKVRDKKAWGVLLRQAMGRQRRPVHPLKIARLTLTRRSLRRPDFDNLVSSFKAILDILQPRGKRNPMGLGVIANDTHEVIGVPEYIWEQALRGEGGVTILVEGADEEHI